MKTYSIRTRVFLDFHFGGKPEAIVTSVKKPGTGKAGDGVVIVRITKCDNAAYKVGEYLRVSSSTAVPKKQEFRKHGSCFRWVNTDYCYS